VGHHSGVIHITLRHIHYIRIPNDEPAYSGRRTLNYTHLCTTTLTHTPENIIRNTHLYRQKATISFWNTSQGTRNHGIEPSATGMSEITAAPSTGRSGNVHAYVICNGNFRNRSVIIGDLVRRKKAVRTDHLVRMVCARIRCRNIVTPSLCLPVSKWSKITPISSDTLTYAVNKTFPGFSSFYSKKWICSVLTWLRIGSAVGGEKYFRI